MSEVAVTLVLTSRHGGDTLLECIDAFSAAGGDGLRIIVSECADARWRASIRARCPAATVLHFDKRMTTPELRAAALLAARTEIVAMTTEYCRPAPGWLEAVRRAHEGGEVAAVGGAVEYHGGGRLIDWAVYLCEYGRYMLPFDRGIAIDLPAQNVSYRRSAMASFADLLAPATWEPLWHWRLAARSETSIRDPSIVVCLRKRYRLRAFLAERFWYGRSFAADRMSKRAAPVRFAYAIGTACLPPLLLARIARPVLAKRRRVGTFALALPCVALFTVAWAMGEFTGAIAGAGRSAYRID